MRAYPEMKPWFALIRLHEEGGKIRGKSARKYWEEDRRVLNLLLRNAGRMDLFPSLLTQLQAALQQRRALVKKRGAGIRKKDATETEAILVFRQLKKDAQNTANLFAVHAALFVLIVAHTGLRPIEMIDANLDGHVLWVKNAKRRGDTDEFRCPELSGLPPDLLLAIELMAMIMPTFQSRQHYKAWAKNLAETLARACKKAGIRRLSLYSFRHVALATWSKAGLSPAEIARLSGHTSLASAKHYASGRHGHNRRNVVRSVIQPDPNDPKQAAEIGLNPAATDVLGTKLTEQEQALLFEWKDMPRPTEPAQQSTSALSKDAVREYFDRLVKSAPLGPAFPKFEAPPNEDKQDATGGSLPSVDGSFPGRKPFT